MEKQVKKTSKKVKNVNTWKVILEVNGNVYTSSADNAENALLSLKDINPKTKGIFTFEYDGQKSKPSHLYVRQIKNLLNTGISGKITRAALIKKANFSFI